MREVYGTKWGDLYGEEITPAWVDALSSMTPGEAALGYQVCLDSGEQWPPTLPTFMQRVKDKLDEGKLRAPPFKELPAPTNRAVSARELERMKGLREQKRRSALRGSTHSDGRFTLEDLSKAQAYCKQTGRAWYDMLCELMSHNGWTPDDEEEFQKNSAKLGMSLTAEELEGKTPFLDAWRKRDD